jgi:hypothetical protein
MKLPPHHGPPRWSSFSAAQAEIPEHQQLFQCPREEAVEEDSVGAGFSLCNACIEKLLLVKICSIQYVIQTVCDSTSLKNKGIAPIGLYGLFLTGGRKIR